MSRRLVISKIHKIRQEKIRCVKPQGILSPKILGGMSNVVEPVRTTGKEIYSRRAMKNEENLLVS